MLAALDDNRSALAHKLVLYEEGATSTALGCLTTVLHKATGYTTDAAPAAAAPSVFVIPETPPITGSAASAFGALRRSGNPDVLDFKDPGLFEHRPSLGLCQQIVKQEAHHYDHPDLLSVNPKPQPERLLTVSEFLRTCMHFTRGLASGQRKHDNVDEWLVPSATSYLRKWKIIVGGVPQFNVNKYKLQAAASIILVMQTDVNHSKNTLHLHDTYGD